MAAHHDDRTANFTAEVNVLFEQIGAPLRLEALAGRGLGVIATASLPAGAVVLHERPFVLTVGYEHRKHVCAACLADSRQAGTASGQQGWDHLCECGGVAFCSDACARAAEECKLHSAVECAALKEFVRGGAHDEAADLVIQAIRILCHRAASQTVRPIDDALLEVSYGSYCERLCGFARTRRTGEVLRASAHQALGALPPEVQVPHGELCETLNRQQANVYGVLGHGGQELALSSFVGLFQLFNHSCLPNLVFDCRPRQSAADTSAPPCPPRFALVTLRSVAAGEELCHCYAGSGDSTRLRREYLLLHHGFECDCPRCSEVDFEAEMEATERLDAMRCRRPDCGSGLGYRVALSGSEDDVLYRRCIHCGGDWEDSDEEL